MSKKETKEIKEITETAEATEKSTGTERLNKFIAANGHFSRRKIDEFILEGRVTVNNKEVFNLGTKINPETDKVFIDGERVRVSDKKIYLMMNKPLNVITSVSDDKKRPTVIDILNTKTKIFPVGRLDFHTTGLLILTNDGDFTNKLMNPDFKIWKTYDVKLSRPLDQKHRLLLEKGIKLEGVYTLPAVISIPSEKDYSEVQISISQGKNRQVRRMFENFGYFVNKLHRSSYGNLQLGNLREGEFRKLTNEEVQNLTAKDSKIRQVIAKKEEPKKSDRRPERKSESDKPEGKEGKLNLTRGNKDIKFARYGKDSDKKDFKKKDFKKDSERGFSKSYEEPREKKTRDFKKSYSDSKATRDYKDSKSSYAKDFKPGYNKSNAKSGEKSYSKDTREFKDTDKSYSKDFKSPRKSFSKDSVDFKRSDKRTFSKDRDDKDSKRSSSKSYSKDDSRKFSKSSPRSSDDKKKSFSKDFKKDFSKDFKKDDVKSYPKKSFGSEAPKRSFGKGPNKGPGKGPNKGPSKSFGKSSGKSFGKGPQRSFKKR